MLLRQVETFVKVADLGSFTRAAGELFVTPASVMKQMNELERSVGTPLLVRDNRGIGLTAAGQSLYRDAVPWLRTASAMVERARKASETSRPVIRVGTAATANPSVLPRNVWAELRQRLPEVALSFVPFDEASACVARVLATMGPGGAFDCLVGVSGSLSRGEAFAFLQLGRIPLEIAVPQGHPLSLRTNLEPADLDGSTLMLVPAGDSPFVDAVRADLRAKCPGLSLVDTPTFYDMETFNTAERTESLLLTTGIWANVHPNLVTLPVNWSFTIPFGVTYPYDSDERVRRFAEALANVVHDLGGLTCE